MRVAAEDVVQRSLSIATALVTGEHRSCKTSTRYSPLEKRLGTLWYNRVAGTGSCCGNASGLRQTFYEGAFKTTANRPAHSAVKQSDGPIVRRSH